MNPNQALNLLRNNPAEAFKHCAFKIVHGAEGYEKGGKCTVSICTLEKAVKENMFLITLRSDKNGDDYHYPYINGKDSIGSCNVPKSSSPGTLVFTGGMNGCSIQVDNDNANNSLKFMHCNNGCGETNSHTLCRIDFEHFAGPRGMGLNMLLKSMGFMGYNESREKTEKQGKVCNPAYFPITIKRDKWEVYASCIAEEMLFDINDRRFHKVPGTYLADLYKISSFET
jgi:hypothetical protein